jgi:hypothetical protein
MIHLHAAIRATRFEFLEPIRQGVLYAPLSTRHDQVSASML